MPSKTKVRVGDRVMTEDELNQIRHTYEGSFNADIDRLLAEVERLKEENEELRKRVPVSGSTVFPPLSLRQEASDD